MAPKPTQKDKIMSFFEGLGVDNPEDLLNGDVDTAGRYGREINKAISAGERAVGKLEEMQNRNVDQEIIDMGYDPQQLKIKYGSVEEFSASVPCFVCAESVFDQKLKMFDGSQVALKAGDNVCLTAGMYKQHVIQHATLKPAVKTFIERYSPYNGQDLTGKTLFVWRSGGIGDLMFIRPILMAFKAKYKDVKIMFATREHYHSMVEQWDDCIDDLHAVPFDADKTLGASDYHISYEGLIERCIDAERIDVHDLFAKHSRVEVTDYNCKMKCVCQNHFFDIIRNEYAVVQIGSSSPIRTPFHGTMVKVIDHLTKSIDVIISGSPREQRTIDDLISCCERPERIINFAKYTGSIIDAVKLVTGSKLVVAPDSSHVHMAAAQGVPCVGIYGPFPARVRAKHYKNFIGVDPDASECCTHGGKGCFTHSHMTCKWQTKCWNNLSHEKVIDAIDKLIGE